MKQRSILFSTPMVQATIEGRKTQTRRIVKAQPNLIRWMPIVLNGHGGWCDEHGNPLKCNYEIGDHLWVREMHYRYGSWKKNGQTKTGRQKWKFIADAAFNEVRFFDNPPNKIEKNAFRRSGWYKRLARFMPRSYSRISLEITNIAVERLQDISPSDAKLEGIESVEFGIMLGWRNYLTSTNTSIAKATESFRTLWQSINGPESWEANPWVWVISFKKDNNNSLPL